MRRVATGLLCVLVASRSALGAGIWQAPGGGMAFVLAVASSRPGTAYAGTERGGIFASANAGRNWRRLVRSRRPSRVKALAAARDGTVYASDADGRVLVSTDGGTRWKPVDAPADVLSLAVDRRSNTVYAGTSGGEVRRSADRGATWSGSSAGLERQPVVTLAIDPRRRRGVVWAGTMAGIFRSADGGATWRKTSGQAVRKMVVDPTRPHTLFAANEGVFRSVDGGRTWRRIPNIRYALSVVVDRSTRPGTVYVGTSYTRVLKTGDGGETWSPAGNGLPELGEVLSLAVDSRTRPTTLYAGTSVLGVYRSTDAGASWLPGDGPAP